MTMKFQPRHIVMAGIIVLLLIAERFPNVNPFPDVGPRPDNAPITVQGLHVLMVYEAERQDKLMPDEVDIIESAQGAGDLRKWLDANAKGNWHLYDQNIDLSDSPAWVKEAMSLHPADEIPWILVANSDSGYKGKFPDGTESDMVKFLEGFK